MRKGCKVRLGVDPEGNRIYGTVIFVHPRKRFMTIERPAPYGARIRESVYLGIRRGQGDSSQR